MNGWRLADLLSLLLLAMSVSFVVGHADVESLRLVIRATARTSLILFAMAFAAGALVELAPNGFTLWQRRNRRYLGVSFAVSHGIHLVALIALARDRRRAVLGADQSRQHRAGRNRLCPARGDDGDLVRPDRGLARRPQVAAAAPRRRLVHLDQLRGRGRQAPAAGPDLLGHDGAGARRGDRPAGRNVTSEPAGEGGYRLRSSHRVRVARRRASKKSIIAWIARKSGRTDNAPSPLVVLSAAKDSPCPERTPVGS